ncbi:MAG: TIGR04295 family B12-binding domain-containing radical SAM protein [Hyphomicrobium sp.]|nr:TIGR04295 family B12-binding domain-containing radical SAM protein [Hyphomicrobium sp.]
MRVALVNPRWDYTGSIYFGCRAPHLPLEFGYARALLQDQKHDVLLIDAHASDLSHSDTADAVAAFGAEMTVIATAPTYLFWRCAPPELRVPIQLITELDHRGGRTIVVGPHGSVTPAATLRKLQADIVVLGECEDALVELASDPARQVAGTASLNDGHIVLNGRSRATDMTTLPALVWEDEIIHRHDHHHHRFDREPTGPGAEVEASRGCPYHCSFCAKMDYRDAYRRRNIDVILKEIDGLVAQGVQYLYFIDEIFLPNRPLLDALIQRPIEFGVQTRIDLWSSELLELLGRAGCVSIEAGVESLTEAGRHSLDKKCRLSTEELADRLIAARRQVPFVQANLIAMADDEADLVMKWRERLQRHGVWANDPVPLYPYPSSPEYRRLFGAPDDFAWERAHAHYLAQFPHFSDIQEIQPSPLQDLEEACLHG